MSKEYTKMNRRELVPATEAVWQRLTQYQLDHPCSLRRVARDCGISVRAFEGYQYHRSGYILGRKLVKIDAWLKARGY